MNDLKVLPTKKWPNDWDKHILNTVQFYFEDHSIVFENFFYKDSIIPLYDNQFEKSLQNNIELFLHFKYNKKYLVILYNIFGTGLNGFCYVETTLPNVASTHPNMLKYIALFKTNSPYACCQSIEKIILDNENRNDGGDSDDTKTPKIPFDTKVPSEVF